MGNFRSTSNLRAWVAKQERNLNIAMLEMATDVHRGAEVLAPKDIGALKKSGKIERKENAHFIVSFGNSDRVPYAVRRHFENKKNPQTLLYLQRSAEAVERSGIKKYLRS